MRSEERENLWPSYTAIYNYTSGNQATEDTTYFITYKVDVDRDGVYDLSEEISLSGAPITDSYNRNWNTRTE